MERLALARVALWGEQLPVGVNWGGGAALGAGVFGGGSSGSVVFNATGGGASDTSLLGRFETWAVDNLPNPLYFPIYSRRTSSILAASRYRLK